MVQVYTYCNLLQDQVEKCEQNVADHEDYQANYKDCMEWIEAKNQELLECSDMPSDNEALESKLDLLQVGAIFLEKYSK